MTHMSKFRLNLQAVALLDQVLWTQAASNNFQELQVSVQSFSCEKELPLECESSSRTRMSTV